VPASVLGPKSDQYFVPFHSSAPPTQIYLTRFT